MRKPIFFDSWGWIAVVDRKEPYHKVAKAFYQEYIKGGGIPTTTDYILDEVLTVLWRRLDWYIRCWSVRVTKKKLFDKNRKIVIA